MKRIGLLASAYLAAVFTVLPVAALVMLMLPPLILPMAFLGALPLAFLLCIFSACVDDQFWSAPRPSIAGAVFGGACCLLLFFINPPRGGTAYSKNLVEFLLVGIYLGGASMTWMNVFIQKKAK